jgi:hypothetical protein
VSQPAPDSVAVAHVCYSWPEAEVVTCMLRAAGIDAVLADRLTIGNNWHMSVALGGFRVLVLQGDAALAAEIISEFRSAPTDIKLPESEAFWDHKFTNFLWLVVNYFFGWCPAWLRHRKG